MYGAHINKLHVLLKVGSTVNNTVWTRTGSQNDTWYQAEMDIQGNSSYQIVIEGVRGTGTKGDIAVDDISVSDGSCKGFVLSNTVFLVGSFTDFVFQQIHGWKNLTVFNNDLFPENGTL